METFQRTRSLAMFAAIAVIGLGFVAWVLHVTAALPKLGGEYTIRAVTPQAATLTTGARVTSAGVAVGRVKSVKREGLGAVVEMAIDDDGVSPLPRDSVMRVRQRTPVGENYVELDPGNSAHTLASGATLPLRQPDDFVELDQVLSVLDGPTKTRARQLIQSLGAALDGRGPRLNRLVGGASGTLQGLSTLADTVGRHHRQLKTLVRSTGRITAAIGERQAAIHTIANQGLTTVEAVAARDDALRSLLRVLPSTLSQVRTSSNTLSQVTGQATPVVGNLALALHELRPTVRRLRPAAQQGRNVVKELGRAISPLTRTLREARALSKPGTAALPKLGSTLCELNPMLRYIERYRHDLASTISNMQSATNSYDAIGHLARVSIVTGENAVAALPDSASKSLAALFHTGIVGQLQGLEVDPYPAPGKIGSTGLSSHPPQSIDALVSSGYKFTRVKADC